jgi:hypothetical protein
MLKRKVGSLRYLNKYLNRKRINIFWIYQIKVITLHLISKMLL